MPFPPSLKLITLTGDFRDGADNGNPREGVVTITLPTPIRSQGDDVIIPPFDLEIEVTDGTFSQVLPATTDPEWEPNTAAYIVQAVFPDGWRKLWWSFALPYDAAGDTLDLADVGAPNVGTPSVTVRQGTTSPIADGGYRGTWAAGTLYRIGDTIQYGSNVYGALRVSAGVTPGTAPSTWKIYPSSGGGGVITSVFGRTGDVVAQSGDYTKAQVGLGNVDNTSDLAKPISTATQAALDVKQPLDSDLTAIAALTPANDDVVQRKAGAWTNRSMTQLASDLQTLLTIAQSQVTGLTAALAALQPLDSDLTTIAGLTATTDNMIQSVAGAWASRTPAQVKAALAIAQSDVAGLTAALALLAPLASPALTGTATVVNMTQSGRALVGVDVLTDAATIAVDASLGNQFSVTLGGNRTLGNPTNAPGAGLTQMMIFLIKQDGTGSRTLTLDTNYRLGADVSSVVLSTAANKTDFLGVRWNQPDGKWDVIAFVKGY